MTTVLFAEHPTKGVISAWTVSDDDSLEARRKEMQSTFRDCAITHRTVPGSSPRAVRVTIRQYDSNNVEERDAVEHMTWGAFVDINDSMDPEQVEEILIHLVRSTEPYFDGGGAAARWSIERAR